MNPVYGALAYIQIENTMHEEISVKIFSKNLHKLDKTLTFANDKMLYNGLFAKLPLAVSFKRDINGVITDIVCK